MGVVARRIRKAGGRGRRGQSVQVDFSALVEFQEQLEALTQEAKEEFMEGCVNEITSRLLAKVTKRTPVITGELRRNWTAKPAEMTDGACKGGITNSKQYAPYVEYGHRTGAGKGWVKGRFMMTKSRQEVNPDVPGILLQRFKKFLEGTFHAK